jgi:hypothetical protein
VTKEVQTAGASSSSAEVAASDDIYYWTGAGVFYFTGVFYAASELKLGFWDSLVAPIQWLLDGSELLDALSSGEFWSIFLGLSLVVIHVALIVMAVRHKEPFWGIGIFLFPLVGDIAWTIYYFSTHEQRERNGGREPAVTTSSWVAPQPPTASLPPHRLMTERLAKDIRELARLREEGLLTQEEFEKQKSRLLSD